MGVNKSDITKNRFQILRKTIKGGISNRRLADELKEHNIIISYTTLSSIENGTANPSWDVISAIADYYEVTVDYLMGRDNALVNYAKKDISNIQEEQFEEEWQKKAPELKAAFKKNLKTLVKNYVNNEKE